MSLIDRFQRVATDLRVSVIDKCNLRCTYCMPADGLPWLPKAMLMTADEIARLVRIGHHQLGVKELRLTGGEPLVRRDLEEIVAQVRADCPTLPISMTTNAVGLDRRARSLLEAGMTRLNVSLDSLNPHTFQELTRRPFLDQVLAGLRAADAAGFAPVKINAVLLHGVNDHEAPQLLEWALESGYELRFIEHMPLDGDRAWRQDRVVGSADLRESLSRFYTLHPVSESRGGAPAELFDVFDRPGTGRSLGRVGLISSVTEPFCAACTRTRVTAEGRVRSCLFSHEETDLLSLIRDGATDSEVSHAWRDAMWRKPRAHGTDRAGFTRESFVQPQRTMSAIGG
nr:GTP 3',8-cyclase MoaA [Microbacterium sp. Leaf288]